MGLPFCRSQPNGGNMAPRASGLCTSQPQRSGLAPDLLIGLMGNQEKSRNMSEFYIKIYIYISNLMRLFFTTCLLCDVWVDFPIVSLQPRLWMAWPALVGFSFTAKCWGQATGRTGYPATWDSSCSTNSLGQPQLFLVYHGISVYHLFLGPIFFCICEFYQSLCQLL